MRKLHVKTYTIEREDKLVTVHLNELLVAEWTPLNGLSCVTPEARVDGAELAQACAEEWVRPSGPQTRGEPPFPEMKPRRTVGL